MDLTVKIAKLLLDAGCDPTCKTKEGRTALMMAIEQVKRAGSLDTFIQCCARARHCEILEILPPMPLKNATSAGLRAHLENLLIISLFTTIFVFSVI